MSDQVETTSNQTLLTSFGLPRRLSVPLSTVRPGVVSNEKRNIIQRVALP